MQQGRIAAHNMAGKMFRMKLCLSSARQFDLGLLYVGHAADWDEIIFSGDVAERDFLAFYVKDNRVLAVAGMNREKDLAAAEELMRLDQMPSSIQLRHGPVNFPELLSSLKE